MYHLQSTYNRLMLAVSINTMGQHPETVKSIIKACVLLHNVMRDRYPVLQNNLVDRQDRDGLLAVQGPNRASKEGKELRNLIRHWCNSPAGSVPWQGDMVDM